MCFKYSIKKKNFGQFTKITAEKQTNCLACAFSVEPGQLLIKPEIAKARVAGCAPPSCPRAAWSPTCLDMLMVVYGTINGSNGINGINGTINGSKWVVTYGIINGGNSMLMNGLVPLIDVLIKPFLFLGVHLSLPTVLINLSPKKVTGTAADSWVAHRNSHGSPSPKRWGRKPAIVIL